jgi:hypothetical protein
MNASTAFFLVFHAIIAVVGLLALAAARDLGMTIFGAGLLLFGLFFGFAKIKAHFDRLDAARH